LATSFRRLYKTGRLGIDYQDIYFLKHLVRPGDFCIDIGAHLGYFAIELARISGNTGHVYAIEPMSKFYNTLKALVQSKGLKNITLYPYAMGGDSAYVDMGIPKVNNAKKFAYARIMKSSTFLEYVESEKVKNVSGDELFSELSRMDFIKCDVEGLEISVIKSFSESIAKHRPIILCELSDPRERKNLFELFSPYNYSMYYLENKKLRKLQVDSTVSPVSHNHYFIPESRLESLAHLMQSATNPL
jgi:FkbM family methyltransferase